MRGLENERLPRQISLPHEASAAWPILPAAGLRDGCLGGGAMNWQPIETAPKDGTEILTCDKGLGFSVRYWGENEDGDNVWLPRIRGVFPTHWMPLPSPPEETP